MGSVFPRKCDFYELCPEEGMFQPEPNSGLILAAMVLTIMFGLLIFGVKLNNVLSMRGRKHADATFEERFNAFSRNIKMPAFMAAAMTGEKGDALTPSEKEAAPKKSPNSSKRTSDTGTELAGSAGQLGPLDMRPSADSDDDEVTMEDDDPPEGSTVIKVSLLGRETISSGNNSMRDDTMASPMRPTLGSGSDRGIDIQASTRLSVAANRELKIDLAFQDLSVELASGLRILNKVTGRLEAGKMTAIMGPSGCG